ncbi:TetR/AcrR family transcriptional regulator [Nocardia sp. NPDC058176]|uniref:TetR/AcrR family transcriptional regulator n=1 Tax=Nocardia sp. NPDC058176 TaxID=3346368 RepID=UPI0036DDA2B7
MSVTQPTDPVAPVRRRGRPPGGDRGAAQTRARIRAAAIELFADRGFHATGVAEIGAKADVQRGALYYHIGSKQELLWEILRDYTRLLLDDAERIVAAGADPVQTLRELIRSHVELIVAHRRTVTVHVRDADALTAERAADLQRLRDRIQRLWQDVVDAGHAAGLLRSADHVVTNGLLGMLNSLGFWYRERGVHSPAEIAEIAEILTETVLSGLIAPGDHTKG